MTDFGLGSQCREHWRRGPNCAAWGHGFGRCWSWIEPFLETSYVRFHRSRRTSVKSESQCDTEAASLGASNVLPRESSAIRNNISDEITAGTATAIKMSLLDQFRRMSSPPSTGPTMEPTRPIPKLQPMPVERSVVG